ncbi:hypothetical protein [Asticcacaulis solisilvae]|uniref:hypothetical protein n=1 Tax=Asticcacaulis solisilvae TaxID=1217274 RepID=UPI003FD7BB1A
MILVRSENKIPELTPGNTKQPVLFHVRKRLKLWVVMRDDIYAGSYPDEDSAQAAGQKHVDAIIRSGGEAKMVYPSAE